TEDTRIAVNGVGVEKLLNDRSGIGRFFRRRFDIVFESQLPAFRNEHFRSLAWFVFIQMPAHFFSDIVQVTLVNVRWIFVSDDPAIFLFEDFCRELYGSRTIDR